MDLFNALFELAGSVLVWLNFRKLLKDRTINGVDWRVTVFYSVWGMWNVPYYYSVGHILSCLCAVGICAGNTSWVVLALRIRSRARLGA